MLKRYILEIPPKQRILPMDIINLIEPYYRSVQFDFLAEKLCNEFLNSISKIAPSESVNNIKNEIKKRLRGKLPGDPIQFFYHTFWQRYYTTINHCMIHLDPIDNSGISGDNHLNLSELAPYDPNLRFTLLTLSLKLAKTYAYIYLGTLFDLRNLGMDCGEIPKMPYMSSLILNETLLKHPNLYNSFPTIDQWSLQELRTFYHIFIPRFQCTAKSPQDEKIQLYNQLLLLHQTELATL